ncbi:Pecanex-like protein 4 [Geranomyces variabilis]|nr:Pecanex-like protein 4 [Geranomyces variabilis]
MTAPLLNDDKAFLAVRRVFRTLAGGPRLAPYGTTSTNWLALWAFQLVVFLTPWIGGVIVYDVWDDDGCKWGSVPNIIYGVIMLLLIIALHLPTCAVHGPDMARHDEEDERPLSGPPWKAAYMCALANHPSRINAAWIATRTAQAIVAGVFLSACLAYLAPARLADSFYHEDRWRLDVFTRPMYLALIMGAAGLERYIPSLYNANYGLAIVWMTMPLLWCTGVLPCLRIFVQTVFERVDIMADRVAKPQSMRLTSVSVQGHTTILGAPACVTHYRTIFTFLLLTLPALTVTAVLLTQVSLVAGCCAAAGAGCVVASRVWLDLDTARGSQSRQKSPLLVPQTQPRIELAWLFIRTLVLAGVVAAIAATRGESTDELVASSDDDHPATIILLIITVALAALVILTRELQSIYLPSLVPIFRNPLQTFRNAHASGHEIADDGRADIIWGLGFLHMCGNTILPFITTGYVLSRAVLSEPALTPWAWTTVVLVRAFRQSWTRPLRAAIVVSILAAVDTGLWYQWRTLHIGSRLLIISVLWEILGRIWKKTGFWLMLLGTFLVNKTERRPRWCFYLLGSLITTPLVIVVSAVLDAPMMPILGLPIFWVGFARPTRFWPALDGDYTPSGDSHLYATLLPALLPRLSREIAHGGVPSLDPSGDILLARLGPRLIIIRCIESYYEGPVCIVTGVELEPTSCHAREGTVVDNLMSDVFDGTAGFINKSLPNTLQPTSLLSVDAYTDTRVTAAGIFDNPQVLNQIPEAFVKALVWLFIKDFGRKKVLRHATTLPAINRESLQSCMERFPTKWYDFITFLELRTSKHRPMQTPRNAEQRKIAHSAIVDVLDDGSRSVSSTASRPTARGSPTKRRVANAADEDEEGISMLTSVCYATVFGITSPLAANASLVPDQESLMAFFRGDLPARPGRAWLSHPDRVELRTLVLVAARYAVRLVYERGANGGIGEAFDVLDTLLRTYHTLQHTSLDPSSPNGPSAHPFDSASTPFAWQTQMQAKTDVLFGLSFLPSGAGTSRQISVRTVRREKDVACWLGTINGESCRGLWANLVMELLYLTNDDDERYSIQAHDILLRNLTVQTANPPLGYPLYVSQATLALPFPGRRALVGLLGNGARNRKVADGREVPGETDKGTS